jgi:hypothetical protein
MLVELSVILVIVPPISGLPKMNKHSFFTSIVTSLAVGLGIQIHGSERLGRREKDLRNSSPIVEHYWFWMAWSRSKIRLVHKKGGWVSRPFRRFYANSLPSIPDFA